MGRRRPGAAILPPRTSVTGGWLRSDHAQGADRRIDFPGQPGDQRLINVCMGHGITQPSLPILPGTVKQEIVPDPPLGLDPGARFAHRGGGSSNPRTRFAGRPRCTPLANGSRTGRPGSDRRRAYDPNCRDPAASVSCPAPHDGRRKRRAPKPAGRQWFRSGAPPSRSRSALQSAWCGLQIVIVVWLRVVPPSATCGLGASASGSLKRRPRFPKATRARQWLRISTSM